MAEQSLTTRRDAAKAELELTNKQIAQAEDLRKQALLDDDDKRAVELAARLDKLQQQVRTARDKVAVLQSEISREAEEKKAQAMAATKAQVEAKLDARDEAVKELAASIQVFDDCYRKAIRLCKEVGTAWPWQPHDREAALLTPSSVVAATKHQLFKVGTQPRLLGGMDSPDRGPDLPGGQSPRLELINNPGTVKPMIEVFAAATRCAREILHTGKSTSGEIIQTNIAESGVPIFARKDKPPLTASQQELSQLLSRMNLLSQQTSPEAEKEYFQTVKRVGELQDLITAEQGTTTS
jgi:hypothetical protein